MTRERTRDTFHRLPLRCRAALLSGLFFSTALLALSDDPPREEGKGERKPVPVAREAAGQDHDHEKHEGHEHPAEPVKAAARKSILWHRDLEEGIREARKISRLVLVDFEAEWCGFCKKLDRETYTHEDVIRFVSDAFVAVKVDVDRHPDLGRRFRVSGLPTILFLDPAVKAQKPAAAAKGGGEEEAATPETAEGDLLERVQELGRIEGFRPPDLFLAQAQKATVTGASLARLRKEATEKPDDGEAQRAYGRALVAGGKIDVAEKHLREALERLAGDAGLLFEYAEVLRLKSRFADAVGYYRKVLDRPSVAEKIESATRISLARCLISVEELQEAESVLGGLLARIPAEIIRGAPAPPEGAAGNAEEEAGTPRPAKLPPALLEGLFLRGYVRALLEKPKAALQDLRIARDADPDGEWGFRASFVIARLEI